MGIVDNPQAYRAGKTAYADVGALYRASFERVASADPPLGQVAWRIWSAVMVATVGRSKLLDRTSLNVLADAAGIHRKGGGGVTAKREEARATAAALAQLFEAGAITYVGAKGGRPAAGEYRPVVVGLPDPAVMGVTPTPIPPGKWGSGHRENRGLGTPEIGVSQTPLTEKVFTEKVLPRGRRGRPAADNHKAGAFTDEP